MFPGEPPVIHRPILVFFIWVDKLKDGNSSLPHWGYKKQMKKREPYRMPPERIQKLERIGVVWDAAE